MQVNFMGLISVGSSEHGVLIGNKSGISICGRHLAIPKESSNPIFFWIDLFYFYVRNMFWVTILYIITPVNFSNSYIYLIKSIYGGSYWWSLKSLQIFLTNEVCKDSWITITVFYGLKTNLMHVVLLFSLNFLKLLVCWYLPPTKFFL